MSSSPHDLLWWLPIASLVIALVGVFCGPLVQLYIAKKQIRATIVSANRMNWIGALRDDLVEYLSITAQVGNLLERWMTTPEKEFTPEIMEKLHAAEKLHLRIILRLNPNEVDHQELLRRIEAMKIKYDNLDAAKLYNEARERLLEHARLLLKAEWDRVKRGQ